MPAVLRAFARHGKDVRDLVDGSDASGRMGDLMDLLMMSPDDGDIVVRPDHRGGAAGDADRYVAIDVLELLRHEVVAQGCMTRAEVLLQARSWRSQEEALRDLGARLKKEKVKEKQVEKQRRKASPRLGTPGPLVPPAPSPLPSPPLPSPESPPPPGSGALWRPLATWTLSGYSSPSRRLPGRR